MKVPWSAAPVLLLIAGTAACTRPSDDRPRLVLGTTHTVEDSELLDALVDAWNAGAPPHRLSVVVAGSGEVLALGRRGDVDVLLTHSPDDEEAFMAAGHGRRRDPVMHNEFVLAGPAADPAGVRRASDVLDALRRIRGNGAPFISRGDDSGTHRRERALWTEAGVEPDWAGHVEAGTSMADLLRLASQRGAYTLTDRATFETLRSELQLEILARDSARLHNPYSVIIVTRAANAEGAESFARWLRERATQAVIRAHGRTSDGRPLFVPDTTGAAPSP